MTSTRRRSRAAIPVRSEASLTSACYAPHTSMYFDQFGKVRACCQAYGVEMGDVAHHTIRQIWESESSASIRSALEHDDYTQGCDFCDWQQREDHRRTDVFARKFDHLRPDEVQPRWPRQMEFALTNACNLQCVMCNGNWSSSIRTKREGRPPMKAAYGDEFFDQLAEFLPHLDEVEFFGGEPFLGAEPLRVMAMLAELDAPPAVTITTNGTICTPRVQALVRQLRPKLVISIDGATADTFAAIRVGADLGEVLGNLDWFCAELGTDRVSLAHCLMTSNHQEFAAFLHIAEERGLNTGVNVVRFPADQSLYHLDAQTLAPVVERLEATPVALTGSRLDTWEEQLAALRARLAVVANGGHRGPQDGLAGGLAIIEFVRQPDGPPPPALSRWAWLPFPEAGSKDRHDANRPDDEVDADAVLRVGRDGVVIVDRPAGAPTAALDGLRDVSGEPFEALIAFLTERHGPPTGWDGPGRISPADDDRFSVRLPRGPKGAPPVQLTAEAMRDHDGDLVGAWYRLRPAVGQP